MTRFVVSTRFIISGLMALALLLCLDTISAEEPELYSFQENVAELFPFRIVHGLPDNITNVRTWGPATAAGEGGFIKPDGEQFVNNEGEIRFLGTNLCNTASFPKKENAAAEAEALARFGINVVRIHHADSRCIWGENFERTKTEIDTNQLDKLDYFIAELEKNGIYVNLNLHVSRQLDERDGFAPDPKMPMFNKGVDNYDQRMIELQKKFAKDLLTHVNPYTGKKYIDDPGIATIEVNNENSVVAMWKWEILDYLGSPYIDDIQKKWNEWLKAKYGSTEKLRQAWGEYHEPLGPELFPEGKFTAEFAKQGFPNWGWESEKGIDSTRELVEADPNAGIESLVMKMVVPKKGETSWLPQLYRANLSIVKDKVYTLTMKARGPVDALFSIYFAQNHPEWQTISSRFFQRVVNDDWQTFKMTLVATETDDQARLGFASFNPGTWEIADVSLREGGDLDPLDGAFLEDGSIDVPRRYSISCYKSFPTKGEDWFAFLHEVENQYWDGMRIYIKDDLKAQPPVAGTQLNYGFRDPQARYDFCDNHFYWHHPHFPHRSWDGADWLIGDKAMVNNLNGLYYCTGNLAGDRILGQPYTVSEYDHPYPNPFAAEGNLLFSLQGARQNWNGLYQFAWSHGDVWNPDAVRSFFDMCSNQVKLVHLPACWAIFVRGDVPHVTEKTIAGPVFDRGDEEKYQARNVSEQPETVVPKLSYLDSLTGRVGTYLPFKENAPDLSEFKRIVHDATFDTPETPQRLECKEAGLVWDGQVAEKSYLTLDRPGTRLFTGFVADRKFEFDAFELAIGRTWLDWATVTITAMNPPADATTDSFAPGRYLIAATGWMQNTGAKLVRFSKDFVSMASAYQGDNGKAPILCEGIPLTMTIRHANAANYTLYVLDEAGNRAASIAAVQDGDDIRLELGPQYKTLWYELEVK